jgi:predicted NBD/HSP70 family sugar kinase
VKWVSAPLNANPDIAPEGVIEVYASSTDTVTTGSPVRPEQQHKGSDMQHYAGIDVSVVSSNVCVIDETGTIIMETVVETDPQDIADVLAPFAQTLKRVGQETGSLSPWLHKVLRALGLPIVCMEAGHTRAALASMRNKTDKNDARGLAQILRTGWYRPVYIKSDEACGCAFY